MAEGDGDDVEFTMTVRDGETELVMRGQKDAAVIVRSASGEQIYLPPEDFARSRSDDSPSQSARDDSPYQSARDDSPYQSARDDSPYQSARDDSPYQSASGGRRRVGMNPTADGFRIVHPEPVTDVRVLR
jgi:hypothetical protein